MRRSPRAMLTNTDAVEAELLSKRHQHRSLRSRKRELADPAVYEPGRKTRLAELLQAQGELRKRQESLEEQWLEAQEQLEAFLAQS